MIAEGLFFLEHTQAIVADQLGTQQFPEGKSHLAGRQLRFANDFIAERRPAALQDLQDALGLGIQGARLRKQGRRPSAELGPGAESRA